MTCHDILIYVSDAVPGARLSDLVDITKRVLRRIQGASSGWTFLQATSTITTTASYSTGTVDVTNADATVTGTGTTFTSAMVGRKFRVSGSSITYTVTTFTSATEIELDRTYTGDTDTGLAYSIFEDTYSLPSDFMSFNVKGLVNQATNKPLEEKAWLDYVDMRAAGGTTDSTPHYYVLYGEDDSGNKEIILPYSPSSAVVFKLWYRRKITMPTHVFSTLDIPTELEDAVKGFVTLRYLQREEKRDESRIREMERDSRAELTDAIRFDNAMGKATRKNKPVMF